MTRAITSTLLSSEAGGPVKRTVLPSGLRVLSQSVPGFRSVTFGVWVGVGSRDEPVQLSGATHFLEHLLFKGTERRDALEISASLDAVGGEMNAFTGKEYTCYYARVLDSDLPLAVDVICDMITSATLTEEDVESERDVIDEEIAMHADETSDHIHDLFAEQLWGQSPLGRSITGTPESVAGLTRRQVVGWYRRRYQPADIVVSVAGNVEHTDVVKLVRNAFERHWVTAEAEPALVRRGAGRRVPTYGGVRVHHRDVEQAHLVLGMPGLVRNDERRYAAGVLHGIVGGGMSSRLFQEVREKRGLAYSVFTFGSAYADTGMVGVYAGCLPKKAPEVLEVVRAELATIAKGTITPDELLRGKGQMRGSVVMGLEDTGAKMTRIAKAELVYGELPTVDDILARIDAVTLDDVADLAAELYAGEQALTVMGPFDEDTSAFGL
ncbi:putative Zn-dependent peptidase [Kribbella orskensis]|uniref:Zn-dependent peptidase n=1 Tax=Kribbella orskensis TaxID=2512216 RepID=A0ABY2BUR4_9ACTN|nr:MULTISPECIES: pitrilysin family protein [Kribbella]TCN43091.1 putative Zn-dependent peptidase [Kribbella sp. VKM Ac-2500]TCO29553.1 putative Zn-dependent peptidase [Kribbella orskensis]